MSFIMNFINIFISITIIIIIISMINIIIHWALAQRRVEIMLIYFMLNMLIWFLFPAIVPP